MELPFTHASSKIFTKVCLHDATCGCFLSFFLKVSSSEVFAPITHLHSYSTNFSVVKFLLPPAERYFALINVMQNSLLDSSHSFSYF